MKSASPFNLQLAIEAAVANIAAFNSAFLAACFSALLLQNFSDMRQAEKENRSCRTASSSLS